MNRVSSERKLKSMTQKDLAEHLHVDSSTVGRWENGGSIPDDKLREMRTLFGCDLDWLVGLSNERKVII